MIGAVPAGLLSAWSHPPAVRVYDWSTEPDGALVAAAAMVPRQELVDLEERVEQVIELAARWRAAVPPVPRPTHPFTLAEHLALADELTKAQRRIVELEELVQSMTGRVPA